MPITGNLQGTKGTIGKDRFDVFIWALHLYYNYGIDLIINSHTTVQSIKELIEILNCFERDTKSPKSYYKFFCDLNEDIVNQLVISGEKRIDTTDRVLDYIVLAYKVWNIRKNNFDHNQCRELFYKLGGEDVFYAFLPYISQLNEYGYKIERDS